MKGLYNYFPFHHFFRWRIRTDNLHTDSDDRLSVNYYRT